VSSDADVERSGRIQYTVCVYFVLYCSHSLFLYLLFFFNHTATTEIYTLSLHDALPILKALTENMSLPPEERFAAHLKLAKLPRKDRKSTRLNSSHRTISYAVFCLKKKKNKIH